MVHDWIAGIELGIFVFNHIVTVGTTGQNFFGFVLIEHFSILHHQHLSDIFVAGAAGHIPVAGFLGPQDGKVDAGFL